MKVGELFYALGLFFDPKEWNVATAVIDKMTAEMKSLALAALTAKTDTKKAMDVIGLSAVKPKSNLEGITSAGDKVSNTFKRMAMFAAGFFGAAKAVGAVKSVVDLGGKIDDLSQKTGLSTDAIQEWGHAATLGGSNIEAFAGGVTKLSKGLVEGLKKGEGPMVDALKKVGLSMSDPIVKTKNLDAILSTVANKFSKMPDGAEKTALAMDLFGKSGTELIPTLNEGVQSLEKLRQEARDLGVVMDEESVKSLDAFGDETDKAKAALTGLRNQAVVAILPALRELVAGFSAWVKENREFIRQSLTSVMSGLATALRFLGRVVVFVVEHWKLFAAVIAGGTVISALMSIIKMVVFFQSVLTRAAIQAVISWAMILGPILLIGIAIVALGILIYKYRDQVRAALERVGQFFIDVGRKIKAFFVGVWDSIKGAANAVWDAIRDGFKAAFDFVVNLPVIKQLIELVAALRSLSTDDAFGGSAADYRRGVAGQRSLGDAARAMAAEDETMRQSGMVKDWRTGDWVPTSGATAAISGVAPMARGGGPSAGATVTNSYSVQINAGNADAAQVGTIVDDKLREHDERSRRQTAASLGVAP